MFEGGGCVSSDVTDVVFEVDCPAVEAWICRQGCSCFEVEAQTFPDRYHIALWGSGLGGPAPASQ